jgi:DNA (cytosine-5)-methyltransferase 1
MGGGLNEQDAYTGRIIAQPVAFQVGNLIRIGAGSKPNTEVFPTLKGSRSNSDQEPCVAFTSNLGTRGGDVYDDGSCPTVRVGSGIGIPSPPAVAFDARQSDVLQYGPISGPLDTDGQTIGILASAAVRRLTPRECERLQGFPDDWTLVPWRGKPASDGPRYRAIGNSMAVNCMEWIGQRIADVEART